MNEQRYQRQINLPEIGLTGQRKLAKSSVLCVGVGGLGSPALFYLAAAGVGRLGLIDADKVELSNLQRQILFAETDEATAKVDVAKQKINDLNSEIIVDTYHTALTIDNAKSIIEKYEIVIDCSDNFTTHYLINDICYYLNKPNIAACVDGFQGYCAVYTYQNTACLRCLFPETAAIYQTKNCNDTGILGVVPGMLGILQATEVLKVILEIGEVLQDRLFIWDSLKSASQEIQTKQDPECMLCHTAHTYHSLPALNNPVISLAAKSLKQWLYTAKPFLLLDVREMTEHERGALSDSCIPLQQLSLRQQELDINKTTVVYCQSGVRSLYAAQLLRECGFKNVYYLQGGMKHWDK